jgi:hypothetical protein
MDYRVVVFPACPVCRQETDWVAVNVRRDPAAAPAKPRRIA